MKRELFVIRGNITSMFERLECLEREREEREKAERDARYAREREERERKEAEWKREHPILDKFTYMSYFNFETYSWIGDLCNIRFYEWSDINSEPMFFSHTTSFYRFLDRCKINLTDAQNSKIKSNVGCHITCVPGSCDLVVGTSYDSLKSLFNTAKVIAPVPEFNNTVSSVKCLPATVNGPKVISCKVYDGPMNYA